MKCERNMYLSTFVNSQLSFFDKRNILVSEDINYTQFLQQRNTLIAVRMHTTKKKEKTLRNKSSTIVS
jgi:flagellar biosynthesis chaperone FliJ